jgi:hypothetical protein
LESLNILWKMAKKEEEIIPRQDISSVALPIPYAISTPFLVSLLHTSPKALFSPFSIQQPSIFLLLHIYFSLRFVLSVKVFDVSLTHL